MVDQTIGCVVDGHFLPDTTLNLMLQGHLNADNVLHGMLSNEGTCLLVFGRIASTDDIPPPALTLEEFRDQLVRFFKIEDPLVLDTLVFMFSDSTHVCIHFHN